MKLKTVKTVNINPVPYTVREPQNLILGRRCSTPVAFGGVTQC